MKLIIASHNIHKVREFKDILQKIKDLDIVSLALYPDYEPEEEVGDSFEEIASKKALHAAKALDCLVLADDSGLCVPALNNEPGVYSRRYSGPKASDLENRKKLLKEMSSLSGDSRSAYMACALAIATPEQVIKVVYATCEGMIAEEERGSNGFGYDSLFTPLDYHKTFAEMANDVKHRISHRGKALEKLQRYLLGQFPCTT